MNSFVIINSSLIEVSISKAKTNNIDPKKLDKEITENTRSQYISSDQQDRLFRQLIIDTKDQSLAQKSLERIMAGNDLTSINYLSKGLDVARSICRIHLRNNNGQTIGFGTGFLVAPGVLMTNHHVIRGIGDAENAIAEFNYELDVNGNKKQSATFQLITNPTPIAVKHLDFCIVGVSESSIDDKFSLNDFGWLKLNPNPGKAIVGEYLTIIQHPRGEHKQICVRENKLLRYDPDGNTLWYATDTVAGSSGSPAFNNSWQVVALHHSGVPKTDQYGNWLTINNKIWNSSIDESYIAWIANEGIRISKILSYLDSNFKENELAKRVLSSPVPPSTNNNSEQKGDNTHQIKYNDELKITIPVQISLKIEQHKNKSAVSSKAHIGNIKNNSDSKTGKDDNT